MESIAFTAGEVFDELLLIAAPEVEAACIGARLHLVAANLQNLLPARDLLPYRHLVIQRVTALIDIG